MHKHRRFILTNKQTQTYVKMSESSIMSNTNGTQKIIVLHHMQFEAKNLVVSDRFLQAPVS